MNKAKLLSIVLFVLGLACIGMYFVVGNKPSEFTVRFDTQGGTAISEKVVKKGETVSTPDNPTKENAEFVEWQLDGAKYDFSTPVSKDITLLAKWNEIKEYSIEVTLDGQTYTTKVRDGKTLSLDSLKIPSKDGYNIKIYSETGEEFDPKTPITADLKLTAQYIEIKMYTVAFNSNGGSKVDSVKVEEGKIVTEPTTTRDGYDLDGWYLNDTKYDFSTPVTKNITLKAKWNEKGKINVIFMTDNKVYKTSPVKEGTKVSKPSNPTKSGYKFVEWQLNGSAFDFNTKITEETTLTAVFEEVNSYTVTFNSDGGSSVKSQEVEVGKKATKPSNPTKKGYVFYEWQLNGKTYDFSKVVEDNITLKAKWAEEIIRFTVKFDTQGGTSIKDQMVESGKSAAKPDNPTKEGKIFEEWLFENVTYDFKTPVTKDITLTARYRDPKQFTVKFETGDGTPVNDQPVKEGNKAVRPATNPSLSGYRFVEWQLDGKIYDFNTKVYKNITLTAKWEKLETANPDVSDNEGK